MRAAEGDEETAGSHSTSLITHLNTWHIDTMPPTAIIRCLQQAAPMDRSRAAGNEQEGGMMQRGILLLTAIALAGWMALDPLDAQSGNSGQWRAVGGDAAYTRYSPLDQINRNTVKSLKIAWRRAGVDPSIKQQFPDLR